MADAHTDLMRALLADPEHRRRFTTSPSFHHAMSQLGAWLPLWVEAMAQGATVTDAEFERSVELAKSLPPVGWPTSRVDYNPLLTDDDLDEARRQEVEGHDNEVCRRRHRHPRQPSDVFCPGACPCSCHPPVLRSCRSGCPGHADGDDCPPTQEA